MAWSVSAFARDHLLHENMLNVARLWEMSQQPAAQAR
jgi:hypothetical protein